jgi:two-component system, response regulator YesN
MFKVMLIDDEPVIRKGLKNIINWKRFDCEVCAEAADGLDGSDLIKKHLPDIIITDIRMPGIDGLSMLRDIKEVVPESKIIILTGHRDFDYVHEALKLGASDFILKPSRLEELTAVIARTVKELRFLKERTEEFDKLKIMFQQNLPVLREKLLYDVVYEINENEVEILAKMELFGININKFMMLVVQNDSEEADDRAVSQYDRHLYQFGIINTFEEVFSDSFGVISIPLNDTGILFIIMPESNKSESLDVIEKKCTYLQDIVRNCFGFTVTVAVSSEGHGPMQLPQKLKECHEALEHKFYLGNNTVIFHKDINIFFKYNDHSILDKLQKALIEGVKSGNEVSVRHILGDVFRYTNAVDSGAFDYIRNFYMNTISLINNIRLSILSTESDKKTEDKQLSGLHILLDKCCNIGEMNSILEEAAMSVTIKVNSYNSKSIKLILRKAMEYLQTHYSAQITLNEVAEHSYVSTYYISRMFKRELGKNFVDCLNEIRIEKAKELLKDVRYKTYEVAENVGIPDAHYFSRLFKKHVGVTPTEYREK